MIKKYIYLLIIFSIFCSVILSSIGEKVALASSSSLLIAPSEQGLSNSIVSEVYATPDELQLINNISINNDKVEFNEIIMHPPISPIMNLTHSSNKNISPPLINNNLITWSEKSSSTPYNNPVYFNIGENKIYKINISVPNGESIKADKGLLIYRNYNQDSLCLTNISDDIRYNLSYGESRLLRLPTRNKISLYEIKDDKLVFIDNSIYKHFYLFTNDSLEPKQMFANAKNASNLCLSSYNGDTLMLWREGTKLYYCNLDILDENNNFIINTLNNPDCLPSNISTYGNQVIYFDESKKLNIQEIVSNSKPRILPIDVKAGAIFLYENLIYYVDKSQNISLYNLNTLENKQLITIEKEPARIVSNGKDILWKDVSEAYWLANISKLEIIDAKRELLQGEKFPLKSRASYSNNFLENDIEGAIWSSSNEEVISVKDSYCEALSPGEATIMVEYKGEKAFFNILVKEITNLKISCNSLNLNVGEIQDIRAYIVYSDGSSEDVTNQVRWKSLINVIIDGVYYAKNIGTDIVTIAYKEVEASVSITVISLSENDLPPPNPEPKPDYNNRPKGSKSYGGSNNEVYVMKIEDRPQVDYSSIYSRLLWPYSLWYDALKIINFNVDNVFCFIQQH